MRWRDKLIVLVSPVLLAVLMVVWEVYVKWAGVSPFILPPPSRIAVALVDLLYSETIVRNCLVTIYETLMGFAAAVAVGVTFGAILGKAEWLERALNPLIVVTQVIPKISLVPLFILWFGFGMTSKVVIAALLASFPILTNTILGLKSVDRGHRDVMKSLNAKAFDTFWELELPSALPYILTGMEIGIVLATIGAVVGEYLGGNVGLGALAVATLNAMQTNTLFAVIFLLTAIGLTLYLLIAALRRVVIPWHDSAISEARRKLQ